MIGEKHKVLQSIITSIAIYMVNFLLWLKMMTQVFFHYQTMIFSNIFSLFGKRQFFSVSQGKFLPNTPHIIMN